MAVCEAFIAAAHEFGVMFWKESNGDFASYEPKLRARCAMPPAAAQANMKSLELPHPDTR